MLTAGFIAVLVGYTGTAVIVVQAFHTAGASSALAGDWMTVLGWSMAVTTLALSLIYKQPILTAWSTPGAALLVVALQGHGLAEAVGAFMFCGALLMVCGITGLFARLVNWIPGALASAMLAGVLLHFGLAAFAAGTHHYLIVGCSLGGWLIGRRWLPRYATLLMLVAGVLAAGIDGQLSSPALSLSVSLSPPVVPSFSLATLISVGLPLFIVTMVSQNAPGVAMLRGAGYPAPVSAILVVTGLATLVLAPVGGFVVCLSAITAGICLSPDAGADPARRYGATIAAAAAYGIAGTLGGSVASLLQALPSALIAVLAGLALLPAIAGALAQAMADEYRDAAALTFLVTASGLDLAGLGAPFWGLVIGGAAVAASRYHAPSKAPRFRRKTSNRVSRS